MMWPMMYANGTSWWWLGMIINLLFWAVVLYAGYRFFRGLTLGGTGDNHQFQLLNNRDSAEEILRQRYARGEIDREKYREMLEDLKK